MLASPQFILCDLFSRFLPLSLVRSGEGSSDLIFLVVILVILVIRVILGSFGPFISNEVYRVN